MPSGFSRSLYSYPLPESLIAATPLAARDQSRLLVCERQSESASGAGCVQHRQFSELPERIAPGTVIVVNNTKVFPARLLGERVGTGGKVEFFLLKPLRHRVWQGLMKSGARVTPGFEFEVRGVRARVIERLETNSGALFSAEFSEDPVEKRLGEVPLPPYIERQPGRDELEVYNTTFAKVEGSVAAPTAGRHFTPELIQKLRARGVEWVEVTLHVGIGTFKPVQVEDIREHQMHGEWATVSEEAAQSIQRAKQEGRTVLAIGTTTTRTLEGFWNSATGTLDHGTRELDLFIYPGSGHLWSVVDEMVTNFHLPESTLLMMISSFLGSRERALALYELAIKERYRFYSYGDAMWIRAPGAISSSGSETRAPERRGLL